MELTARASTARVKLGADRMAKSIESSPAGSGFASDLKSSISAWRDAPLMPLVAGLLAAFPETLLYPVIGGLAQAIGIAVGLFTAGWVGSSLIWYRQLFEGNGSRPTDLIRLTSGFIARYFLLAFVLLLASIILFFIYSFAGRLGSHSLDKPAGRIGLAVAIGAVFFAATFAYPALAYSTSNVIRAVQIAKKMLIKGWPGNWPYAVAPAAFTGISVGISWFLPPLALTGLRIVEALVALAFLGAIARYYLRSERRSAATL